MTGEEPSETVASRPADVFTVGIGACAVLLLGWLASDTLRFWWWEWTRPGGFYSHGMLVPPLSLLVAWHRRGLAVPKPGNLLFLLPFGMCLLAYLLSVRAGMQTAQSITLISIVASTAAFAGGGTYFRCIALPAIALLSLSMPLPAPLLHDATARLQTLSASGAQALLNIAGFAPVSRTGNILVLPQYTMDVDTPCSGLQTLLTAITLSVALALLSDLPRVRGLLLISLAVPVALLSNVLRIALIGIIGECFGASVAHNLHDGSGYLGTIFCSGLLLFALGRMGCHRLAGQPLF